MWVFGKILKNEKMKLYLEGLEEEYFYENDLLQNLEEKK